MKNSFSSLLIRQTVIALLLTGLSLPLVYALHRLLGLSNPALWGLAILAAALVFAFAGAGALGAAIGQNTSGFRNHGGRKRAIAALCGFLWGTLIVSATTGIYTSMIFDQLSRGGTSLIWNQREQLWTHGRQTWQQWRAAGSEGATEATKAAARETANRTFDESKTLAQEGLATLPALGILLWALIGTPFISAWECRREARF